MSGTTQKARDSTKSVKVESTLDTKTEKTQTIQSALQEDSKIPSINICKTESASSKSKTSFKEGTQDIKQEATPKSETDKKVSVVQTKSRTTFQDVGQDLKKEPSLLIKSGIVKKTSRESDDKRSVNISIKESIISTKYPSSKIAKNKSKKPKTDKIPKDKTGGTKKSKSGKKASKKPKDSISLSSSIKELESKNIIRDVTNQQRDGSKVKPDIGLDLNKGSITTTKSRVTISDTTQEINNEANEVSKKGRTVSISSSAPGKAKSKATIQETIQKQIPTNKIDSSKIGIKDQHDTNKSVAMISKIRDSIAVTEKRILEVDSLSDAIQSDKASNRSTSRKKKKSKQFKPRKLSPTKMVESRVAMQPSTVLTEGNKSIIETRSERDLKESKKKSIRKADRHSGSVTVRSTVSKKSTKSTQKSGTASRISTASRRSTSSKKSSASKKTTGSRKSYDSSRSSRSSGRSTASLSSKISKSKSLNSKRSFTNSRRLRKGRGGRKKKKTRKTIPSIHMIDASPYNISGVSKVILSTPTQRYIGALVGEDVTAENPWKFVLKEKIEDNLELHEDSSEFLAIGNEIRNYENEEILIGWMPGFSDKYDYFYVVHSEKAKNDVIEIMEREKKLQKERLQKYLSRNANPWFSWGSEHEVLNEMVRDLRPLYEIKVNAKYPIQQEPVSWKIRKVEDCKDGYVELLQDARYPLEVVEKKRVTIAVQVGDPKLSKYCQTGHNYVVNVGTQHNYLEPEEEKTVEEVKVKTFGAVEKKERPPPVFKTAVMTSNIEKISDELIQNDIIAIYRDDYSRLKIVDTRLNIDTSGEFHRYASFSDSSVTKEPFVCGVSWNPFVSGIFAVCYSNLTVNTIVDKNYSNEYYEDDTNVLIWSYSDRTYPKLLLEARRQVTAVSFCPYEPDILIGGMINGQIVIWDLGGKVDKAESVEILTDSERRNRNLLSDRMFWMKNIYKKQQVKPALTTGLSNSQTAMITDIHWLNPKRKFDACGNVSTVTGPDIFPKQFMTASLDGTVAVWDLEITDEMIELKDKETGKKQKRSRLKKRPSALTIEESRFAYLGLNYTPSLCIILKKTNNICPVTALLKTPGVARYDCINNYDPDLEIRNYFILSEEQKEPFETPFTVGTIIGRVLEANCGDFEYDIGDKMHSKFANTIDYTTLHDAPISVCYGHPWFYDFFLTIGGTVYALWNINLKEPILWQKSPKGTQYLSGGWSQNHPSYFVCLRTDHIAEFWDLLFNRVKPIRTVAMPSSASIFGTIQSLQCRKNTFGQSDIFGDLIIMYIPDILSFYGSSEVEITKKLFDREVKMKKLMQSWMKAYEEKYLFSLEHSGMLEKKRRGTESTLYYETVNTESTDVVTRTSFISEIEKMNAIFKFNWDNAMEKHMFSKMMKLKGLNIAELKQQKHLLQEEIKLKHKFEKKLDNILADKKRIFKNAKALLFPKKQLDKLNAYQKTHYYIQRKDLSYIMEYEAIEDRALAYISENEYILKPEILKKRLRRTENKNIITNFMLIKNRPRRNFIEDRDFSTSTIALDVSATTRDIQDELSLPNSTFENEI